MSLYPTIEKKYYKSRLKIQKVLNPNSFNNLISIGTQYGGWTIPDNLLNKSSICYLAGAGEDISFDVGIAEKYQSQAYIFDPTPRSKMHFEELKDKVSNNEKMPINNDNSKHYDIKIENLDYLHFEDIGLSDESTEMKFFQPEDPQNISHSLTDYQNTSKYILVKVERLRDIMKKNGHDELDLLKLEIAGAEYPVIDSIIEDDLKIKTIIVQFDAVSYYSGNKSLKKAYIAIKKLMKFGYKLAGISSRFHYLFVRNDVYDKLTNKGT